MPVIEEGFACISKNAACTSPWVAKVVEVQGHKFVETNKGDTKFMKLIGGDLAMVAELTKLRNEATDRLQELNVESGPMQDQVQPPAANGAPRRPRRELIDEVADTVVVTVSDADGVAHAVR
eukprot:7791881-Pyramimonas_sp.AAC.1